MLDPQVLEKSETRGIAILRQHLSPKHGPIDMLLTRELSHLVPHTVMDTIPSNEACVIQVDHVDQVRVYSSDYDTVRRLHPLFMDGPAY